ncbi:serine/threonine protein phosphatase [Solihabitans fulvus]|uniref:Serine/threonine protein phosphatase n=1 Tax=Solihabitans fulvus TaxID=1892852 RepID=A0A5B2WAB7_9PSEU|nr:protein phosphatase 2C domain-containing protein [Solihabitans fulvus]KAA2247680.1 serine/threonine protein phosphatase [Solihabitans fulvus]
MLGETTKWETASVAGLRTVNADAVGALRSTATGRMVFALADGIGDDSRAARAARLATDAAVRTPAEDGPAAAVLAAQRVLLARPDAGDCVLVVAMSTVDGGYAIAWVGDARAYRWDGTALRQATADHTIAEYFRDRGLATSARMEHVVTSSVRTATPAAIGSAEIAGPAAGLLLTSDGVHKTVDEDAMLAVLTREPGHGHERATALVELAAALGGRDNTTALVVDPPRAASGAAAEEEIATRPIAA